MATGSATAANITDLPGPTVTASVSSITPATGSLVFPTQEQLLYGMQFQFMKYQYDISGTKATLVNNINGPCIMLPLPLQLMESLGITYNAHSLGVEGFLFNKAFHGVDSLRTQLSANTGLQGFLDGAKTIIPDIVHSGAYVVRGLIGDASQGIGNSVDLALGNVVNPYTIATFQNAQNRQHSFTFRLIPQNPEDSQTIQDICDNFKWHALPDKSDQTGLFLTMPEEVEVCFFGTEFLYKFARCVITNVQINHAAFGMASFFAQDGAPTAVELTIQLEEIETLTKTAYGTPNTVVQASSAGPFAAVTGGVGTTAAPSDINNSYPWASSDQAPEDLGSPGGGL